MDVDADADGGAAAGNEENDEMADASGDDDGAAAAAARAGGAEDVAATPLTRAKDLAVLSHKARGGAYSSMNNRARTPSPSGRSSLRTGASSSRWADDGASTFAARCTWRLECGR